MAVGDSQTLDMYCTAQKLSKINDFLVFAFAKEAKQNKKSKEAKKQRILNVNDSCTNFYMYIA